MNSVETLMSYFCPFGYLDMKAVCEIGAEVGLYEAQIFEIIDGCRDELGQDNFDHIDPVYGVMEHVLQHARGIIEGETGYDFIHDSPGGTEIYTYGNFMCSSYDFCEEAVDELREVLASVSSNVLHTIVTDQKCGYFLEALDISLRKE